MSDENTPEDAPAQPPADANFVNPDQRPEELDVDAIQDNARQTHSLKARLAGIKQRHTKVLLFMDPEAADEYARINSQLQILNDAAGKVDLAKPGGQESHDDLVARYNALEPTLDEARKRMHQGAMVVELRAYPNIAVKVARRDARKKFSDSVTKQVPQERVAEFNEWIDLQLLGQAIVQIIDVGTQEAIDLGPREQLGELLSNDLPSSQWERLFGAFLTLTLTEEIADAATSEAGF